MFTKTTWIVVLSSVLMTACQGENTFTRESNPYKEYDSLTKEALPYRADRPTPDKSIPIPVTQTQACNEPFKMTIEGSKDEGQSLEFIAGVEKSYTIKVDSRLEQDRKWEVRPVISPCEDCFKIVDKTADSATYKFTWKPTSAPAVQDQFLVLRYDFLVDVRCQSVPLNQSIALIVKPSTSNEPTVSVLGLRSTPIVFGEEALKFSIQITDPKGTSTKAPDIASISYKKDGNSVNGKTAVDCKDKGAEIQTADGQQAWIFDCTFEPKLIDVTDAQMKKLSGSGKTVSAQFSVKAQSKATKLYSDVSTAKVQVLFEKVQGE